MFTVNLNRSELSLRDYRVAMDKLIDVADITNNKEMRSGLIQILVTSQIWEFDYGRKEPKKRTR